MITAMQTDTNMKKHYKLVVQNLENILKNIDTLREDPLFIDNIHGEQELGLDQAIEMLTAIKNQFIPLNVTPELSPAHESGEIDIS
tara:strand:+ start:1547 stop:1804 length:258 start_codon:yes stop_codon:yes gene_type:complete